jgi:hypothetical protein
LYDAAGYSLDLRLCVVPVADAAHPHSADLDQPRNVFPQRLFKMSQIQDKPHPQALRQSEIIYTNGPP